MLFEATVRARLISLIHLNILVLSALWATTTFLAGEDTSKGRQRLFSFSNGRQNTQNAHIDTAAAIN